MADRALGIALVAAGLLLGLVVVAWLVVNAMAGLLGPGGFLVGIFSLLLFVFPLIAAGLYVLSRGAAREAAAASFQAQRRLLDRDRLFRRTLQREAAAAARQVGTLGAARGEAAGPLEEARQTLENVAAHAGQPVEESAWLNAGTLRPADVRDVERYDDLLLAGIRRLREEAERGTAGVDATGARALLALARSAQRQFDLRQDLVLRGRRLPRVSPLHLLRPEVPMGARATPESMRPGDAVSVESDDYLVTAHLTYFDQGRSWDALVLRGEGGERRLQLEPGSAEALLMEPAAGGQLSGRVVLSGTASVSIDSLSGSAEGILVDYRCTEAEGGLAGWWERWPEGERGYQGRPLRLTELQFWSSAVAAA